MWGIPAGINSGDVNPFSGQLRPQEPAQPSWSAPSYFQTTWDSFAANQQQRNDLQRTPDWVSWVNPTAYQNPLPIEKNVIYPALNAAWYPLGTASDFTNQFIAKPLAGPLFEAQQYASMVDQNRSNPPKAFNPDFNQIMQTYQNRNDVGSQIAKMPGEMFFDPMTWAVGGEAKRVATTAAEDIAGRAKVAFPEGLQAGLADQTGAITNSGQAALRRAGATLSARPTVPVAAAAPLPPAAKTGLGSWLQELGVTIEKFATDKKARLNKIGTAAVKAGDQPAGKWGESAVEQAGSLISGASGAAKTRIETALKDVATILGKDAQVVDSVFNQYWVLKHLEEIKRVKPGFKINLGGQQFDTAKDFVAALNVIKTQVGIAAYNKMDVAVRRLSNEMSVLFMKSEALTPSVKASTLAKYKYYHPLVEASSEVGLSSFFKRPASFVKGLGDELATIKHPFDIWAKEINKRVINIANNNLKSALAKAIQLDPKYQGMVDVTTGAGKGNFVAFYEGGVKKNIVFKEGAEAVYKDLLSAIGEGPTSGNHLLINAVKWVQNISRMAYTTFAPAFIARNLTVDALTLWMREGIGPKSYIPALIEELGQVFKEGKNINAMRLAGGEIGAGWAKSMATGTPAKIINGGSQWKKFLNPLEIIKYLGSAVEETPRLATFKKYVKGGATEGYAAMQSRRVTVDFDRFGVLSRALNDVFLFFNAGKEGFLLPFRNLRERPEESIPKMAALAAAVVGISAWNHQFKGYYEIPLSDRMNSIIIYLRDDIDNKGNIKPVYIKIMPILREWSMFTAPFVYAFDTIHKQNPKDLDELFNYMTSKSGQFETGQAAQTWFSGWNPLSQFVGSSGSPVPTQILRTLDQVRNNKDDYHNSPIVPEDMKAEPLPDQYDETTSRTAVALGRALNQSPKIIDFIVQSILGSSGRDAMAAMDYAVTAAIKQDNNPEIANHILALKNIAMSGDANQIKLARADYLNRLQPDVRTDVLAHERLPVNRLPFISNIISSFYREGPGGATYNMARKQALNERGSVPTEQPLDSLRQAAEANVSNLQSRAISKKDYDTARTKYMASYSGASNQNWQDLQKQGYIANSDVSKYLPADQRGPAELQALSAYHGLIGPELSKYTVLTSADYDTAENNVMRQLTRLYGAAAAKYALAHKDDLINNLPPAVQTVERTRAQAIANGTWFKDYAVKDAYRNYYAPVTAVTPPSTLPTKYYNTWEKPKKARW